MNRQKASSPNRRNLSYLSPQIGFDSKISPICDGKVEENNVEVEKISKNLAELEQLRGDLSVSSIGAMGGRGRPTTIKKKDSILNIEKPHLPTLNNGNGTITPSDGSRTPLSGESSDSEAAAYLDFKLETEDGQPGESRRERLNELNKCWNSLQAQMDARQIELMEALQQQLDYQRVLGEVERELADNTASMDTLDSLPLEEQIDTLDSNYEKLLALQPRLMEVSELADMIADDEGDVDLNNLDGIAGGDEETMLQPGPISELQAQVADLTKRVESAITENRERARKASKLLKEDRERSDGQQKFDAELDNLVAWYNESFDQITAEVSVTFDRAILKELLEHSEVIENGSRIRKRLAEEMLREGGAPNEQGKSHLEEIISQFGELTELAKKKVVDLGVMLRLCIKRDEDIESIQSQVSNLQKWLQSRQNPPDLLLPAVIGSEISAAARDTEAMQNAIKAEVGELEAFMSKVHEEGMEFLRMTKPYTVQETSHLPTEDDQGSDTESSFVSVPTSSGFIDQWNYLKHRLEKRQAKIMSVLSNNVPTLNAASSSQRIAFTENLIAVSDDAMQSLESRQMSHKYEPDASTRALQLHFQTIQNCWKTLISQVKSKDRRLDRLQELQTKYMGALNDAITWLDSVELKIFSNGLVRSCEEQLMDHEILFKEMTTFQTEIEILNAACAEVMRENASAPKRDQADRVVVQLKSRVNDLETAIKRKDAKVQRNALARKNQQDGIGNLFHKLEDLRDNVLESLRRNDLTSLDKNDMLSKHQEEFKKVQSDLAELTLKHREMAVEASVNGDHESDNSLSMLERLLDDVTYFMQQLEAKILNDDELKVQFTHVLSEYETFLLRVENKLKCETDSMSASNAEALAVSLESFKEFFEDLDAHWHAMNSFYDQLEAGLKQQFAEQVSHLNSNTLKLKEKGAEVGKCLQMSVEHWESVSRDMDSAELWLSTAQQSPVARLREDMWILVDTWDEARDLKATLTDMQADLYVQESNAHRVLQKARLLFKNPINCPSIETRSSKFEQNWNDLFSTVTKRHEQVYMLVEEWSKFSKLSNELAQWLDRVREKVNYLKTTKYSNMNAAELYLKLQDLMAMARDMVWNEMTLERIGHLAESVKRQCCSHMPKEVETKLRTIHTQWDFVRHEIDVLKHLVQRRRHGVIALHQHLVELSVWIDGLGDTLRQEDNDFVQWTGHHVLTKLHTFQGIELDLSWTQQDLDHINQEAIRYSQYQYQTESPTTYSSFSRDNIPMTSVGTGTRESDHRLGRVSMEEMVAAPPKLDEQIGILNQRWQHMREQVQHNVQILLDYDKVWKEYDYKIESLLQWIEYKKFMLSRFSDGCGHLIGVNFALSQLDQLEHGMVDMCAQLEDVKKLGDELLGRHNHVTSLIVSENETRLHKAKNHLVSNIAAFRSKFEEAKSNWLIYESCLDPVVQGLADAEFTVSTNHVVSGNLESFQTQLQRFEGFERDLGSLQNKLAHLSNITDTMCQICEGSVCEELRDTQRRLFDRWRENVDSSSLVCKWMESVVHKWHLFEQTFAQIEAEVKRVNSDYRRIEDAVGTHFSHNPHATNVKLSHEDVKALSHRTHVLEGTLKSLEMDQLYILKDELSRDRIHTATLSQLDSRVKCLHDDFDASLFLVTRMMGNFLTAQTKYEDFEKFLLMSKEVLETVRNNSLHPTRSMNIERSLHAQMEVYKGALSDLASSDEFLRKCNVLGAELSLSELEKSDLDKLNISWKSTVSTLESKLDKSEKNWLNRISFEDKCEYWTTFTKEIQWKLQRRSKFSYDSLKIYFNELQSIANELLSKQQLMQAILVEGRRIISESTFSNPNCEEVKSKLEDFKRQWKEVANKVDQEKTHISELLEKWVCVRSEWAKLDQWLREMVAEMYSFQQDGGRSGAADTHSASGEAGAKAQLLLSRLQTLESTIEARREDSDHLSKLVTEVMSCADKNSYYHLQRQLEAMENKWEEFDINIRRTKSMAHQTMAEIEEKQQNLKSMQDTLKEVEMSVDQLSSDADSRLERESDGPDALVRAEKVKLERLEELKLILKERISTRHSVSAKSGHSFGSILEDRVSMTSKHWNSLTRQLETLFERTSIRLKILEDVCQKLTKVERGVNNGKTCLSFTCNTCKDLQSLHSQLKRIQKTNMMTMNEELGVIQSDVKNIGVTKLGTCSFSQLELNAIQQNVRHISIDVHAFEKEVHERVEKIQTMLSASKELEQSLDFLKRWFGHVETKLNQPILVHSLEEEKFNLILNQHQELHQDIVNHSENVLSVMQLSELLVADADMFPGLTSQQTGVEHSRRNLASSLNGSGSMDLTRLKNSCKTVSKRWDMITAQSQDRLARINKAWDNSRKFMQSCDSFMQFIDEQSSRLNALEQQTLAVPSTLQSIGKRSSVETVIRKIDEQRTDFRKSLDQLENINKQYRVLSDDVVIFEVPPCSSLNMNTNMFNGNSSGDGLRHKLEEVNRLWSEVDKQFDACEARLKRGLKQGEEFAQLKQTLMIWLMDLDIRVTKVDMFASQDDLKGRMQQLKEIKRDIATHQGRIDYLNLIGQKLADSRSVEGAANNESELQVSFITNELNEFNKLAKSVNDRVSRLEQKLEHQKSFSRPLHDEVYTKRENALETWNTSRLPFNVNRRCSPNALKSHLLLTSSTMDLKTFDACSLDSRDNFARKSASLSALNRRRHYPASTATNATSATPTEDNLSYLNSRTTDSQDPISGFHEHMSGSVATSSRQSDVSSLRFRGAYREEGDRYMRSDGINANDRRNFFAHRPVQTSAERNSDAFNQRHNRQSSLQESQKSDRSSPLVNNNRSNSMLDLDWDHYEAPQHSSDNINGERESSSSVYGSSRNRNNQMGSPTKGEAQRNSRSGSGSTYIKYADPNKKQYSPKQKLLLQKIEPRMGDLHDALVECRQKLDGAEKLLRCATPTGEACEREKQNFSATIAGSKASVDVVKSIFNKLQESERTGLEKSSELCTNVEVCAKRWDVIKSRAVEKRRRLKHNYQLWHQFIADVQTFRDWIVQHSSLFSSHSTFGRNGGTMERRESELFATNTESKRLMKRLMTPEGVEERRLVSLHQLEQLIQTHRELMVGLNGKKTTLMSINMYMERYTGDDYNDSNNLFGSLSHTLNDEINRMNSHFELLCSQAVQTQRVLQNCLVESLEVKKTVNDIVKWLGQVEVDFDSVQAKSEVSLTSSLTDLKSNGREKGKNDEVIKRERYLVFKQLKSEVDTYQPRVNALRATADQLLTNLSSPLSSSVESRSGSRNSESRDTSSSSASSVATELKQDLYLLCNRIRTMQRNLDSEIDKVPLRVKNSVVDGVTQSHLKSTKQLPVYDSFTVLKSIPTLAAGETSNDNDNDEVGSSKTNDYFTPIVNNNYAQKLRNNKNITNYSDPSHEQLMNRNDDVIGDTFNDGLDISTTEGDTTDPAEFQFIDDDLIPIDEKQPDYFTNTDFALSFMSQFDSNNNNATKTFLGVPEVISRISSKSNLTKEGDVNYSCMSNHANSKSCQRALWSQNLLHPPSSSYCRSRSNSDRSGDRSEADSFRVKNAYPIVGSVRLEGILGELCHAASFLPISLDYTAWLRKPLLFDPPPVIDSEKAIKDFSNSSWAASENNIRSILAESSTTSQKANRTCFRISCFSVCAVVFIFLVVVCLYFLVTSTLKIGGVGHFNHVLSLNVELTRNYEDHLPV